MKLLQTIVSGNGFRDVEHNIRRLAVLDDLLVEMASEKVGRYYGLGLMAPVLDWEETKDPRL